MPNLQHSPLLWNAATIVCWVSWMMVVAAYGAYPVVVFFLARLLGSPRRTSEATGELPRVTLLIVAHNEDAVIRERLNNALETTYPPEKLEILAASDGSIDDTANIARSFSDRGVRVLEYSARRGKAATLNEAIASVSSGLVVLSDANTHMKPDAILKLVRWFDRPEISAVCGRLVLLDARTGQNVDSLYWRYETFLKKCESQLGALLGANGAIYAIRRDRFVPIPSETIVDDFVIPLLSRERFGGEIIYDEDAAAYEETPPNIRDEFRRRARIGAGGFQSLRLLWRLLLPWRGWIAFTFFGHKALRWICPFFLITAFVSNCLLVADPFYRATLVAQVGFYGLSLLGVFLPRRGLAPRLVRLTTMFSSMNLALFVGFWKWLLGRQHGVWQRTTRSA